MNRTATELLREQVEQIASGNDTQASAIFELARPLFDELDYAYRVIEDGFVTGTFDLTILRQRAALYLAEHKQKRVGDDLAYDLARSNGELRQTLQLISNMTRADMMRDVAKSALELSPEKMEE